MIKCTTNTTIAIVPTQQVIEQKEEDKMMNLIRQHRANELLGQTQEGRDFCLKALHPASELISSPGIPDSFSSAVTLLRYNTISTHDATGLLGAATTFDAEFLCFKHPVVFGCVKYTDGTTTLYGLILNTTLTPATMSPAFLATNLSRSFTSMCESYRAVYSSVTAHLDAPATASQGTIVAVQYADRPIQFGNITPYMPAGVAANGINLSSDVIGYREYKDYSYLIQMPGAYVSPATSGLYMPLVLDDFEFKTTFPKLQLTAAQSATLMNNLWPTTGGPAAASSWPTAASSGFPYGNGSAIVGATGGSFTDYLALTDRCGDMIGHFVFKGISKQAKVVVNWREGFEAIMQPGSSYAMFQKLSPKIDPLALEAYQVVRRELSGAYPESYNALGALLGTIGSLAATYIPKLIGWVQQKREERKAAKEKSNPAPIVKSEARQAARSEVRREMVGLVKHRNV